MLAHRTQSDLIPSDTFGNESVVYERMLMQSGAGPL